MPARSPWSCWCGSSTRPSRPRSRRCLTECGFTVQDVAENELTNFADGWTANDVNSWPRGLAKVDVLIAGEAFSEFAARIGNIVSCSARAEINLVSRKDGKIVLADRVTTRAADLSENIAGKKALQNAGRALAIRLLEHFADTLPAENRHRRRKRRDESRAEHGGCVCFLAAWAPLQAAIRVALVSSHGGRRPTLPGPGRSGTLRRRRRLLLVERREIARLLAEGQLSLSGMVDAAAAIREGKLLGADVLAVVETDPQGSQALGILAFETLSGCTSAIRPWPRATRSRPAGRLPRLFVWRCGNGPSGPAGGGPFAWCRSATPICRCRPTPSATAWGGFWSAA